MAAIFNKKEKERKEDQLETAKEEVAAPAFKLPKVEDAHSYGSILSPYITEKAGILEGQNKYVFKISKEATKIDVKKAVEKLYKVKVKNVHVITMPSKFRQVGRFQGTKTGFRKAIVTLKEGDRIEITG
jgi:large subunit ribosomal protein L23